MKNDIETIFKKSEMKNTIAEIKNTLERINSRLDKAEDLISDLEDKVAKHTQSEHQKEKRTLKNENSLRDLWDNVKHINMGITGLPEREEREQGIENISGNKIIFSQNHYLICQCLSNTDKILISNTRSTYTFL